MSTTDQRIIRMPDGRPLAIDLYEDNTGLGIWLTHPDTGVRIGLGRHDQADRQPYVVILTEDATEPDVGDEPMLAVALNDADLYDVEATGPTMLSQAHQARVQGT